eukprot:gene59-63_t
MNVLGWAVNLFGQNPIPASGAIDVIAVRQPDGSINCSPFHVKLGTTCKKGDKKVVKLKVDGREVNVLMRLGPAGEAFFLKRTKMVEKKDGQGLPDEPPQVETESSAILSVLDPLLPPPTEEAKQRRRSLSEGHTLSSPVIGSGPASHAQGFSGRRDRSVSDMSRYESFVPSGEIVIEECDVKKEYLVDRKESQVDITTISTINTEITLPENEASSLIDQMAKAPPEQSWIWRWGYLPVKSASNLQMLNSEHGEIVAEGKHPSRSKNPMTDVAEGRAVPEVRETFDDWQERTSFRDENFVDIDPLDSSLTQNEALSSISIRKFDASMTASGKHSNIEHFHHPECRENASPKPKLVEPLEKSTAMHRFRALSLCGDLLSGENAPRSSNELLELLYTHRISEDMFLTQGKSVLIDPRLVIIADDYLLNIQLMSDILIATGNDPFAILSDDFVAPALTISDSGVHQALLRLQEKSRSEQTDLPSWLGKHISEWNVSNVEEERLYTSPAGMTHNPHSQLSLEYFTPASSQSMDDLQASHYLSCNKLDEGKVESVEDFKSWSNAGIGWKESFTDLAEAFRLHQLLNINIDPKRDEIHVSKDCLDGQSADQDDYFFHHHYEDQQELDSSDPPGLTSLVREEEAVLERVLGEVQEVSLSLEKDVIMPDRLEAIPVVSSPDKDIIEGETDNDQLSLQDIAYEDIFPGPPDGDFYESDTDSFLSHSVEGGEEESGNNLDSRGKSSLSSLSFFTNKNQKSDIQGDGKTEELSSSLTAKRLRFRSYRYKKVLIPSKEQLDQLDLRDNRNQLAFELVGSPSLTTQLYLWPAESKIVVVDIGCVFMDIRPAAGAGMWSSILDYGKAYRGPRYNSEAISFLNKLSERGYRILYFCDGTLPNGIGINMPFLDTIQTSKGLRLPQGPIFKSPASLIQAFGPTRTEVFKAAALRGVRSLFPSAFSPFYAAFVSRESDVVAFDRNAFPTGRIFLVDKEGKLRRILVNRSQSQTFKELAEIIEHQFPKLQGAPSISSLSVVSPASPNNNVKPRADTQETLLPLPIQQEQTELSQYPATPSSKVIIQEESYSDYSFWKMPLPSLDEL